MLRLALSFVLLLSCGACASTSSATLAPRVDLHWSGTMVQWTIVNPDDETLLLHDLHSQEEGFEGAPVGVHIRVSDAAGTLVWSSRYDAEGWWSPLRLISSTWRERPPLRLRPGEQLELSLDPRNLVEGMRPTAFPTTDTCRVQVRAITWDPGLDIIIAKQTTDWNETPCVDLFGADWMQYFRGRPSDEVELKRLMQRLREAEQPRSQR